MSFARLIICLSFLAFINCGPMGRGSRREGVLVAQLEPIQFTSTDAANRQKLCPHECSGHGVCGVDAANGFPPVCYCLFMWTGTDCSIALCPNNCSLSGYCDQSTGFCFCNPGLLGADCSQREKVVAVCDNNCNQQGDCISGICKCYSGYTGLACEQQLCQANCSNHGLCWDMSGSGVFGCACDNGWTGDYCQTVKIDCENSCSGHGICDYSTGICSCERGWKAPNCFIRECQGGYLSVDYPHPPPEGLCPNDCSCNGYCFCDDKSLCSCQCQPSWAGDDCSVPIPE